MVHVCNVHVCLPSEFTVTASPIRGMSKIFIRIDVTVFKSADTTPRKLNVKKSSESSIFFVSREEQTRTRSQWEAL